MTWKNEPKVKYLHLDTRMKIANILQSNWRKEITKIYTYVMCRIFCYFIRYVRNLNCYLFRLLFKYRAFIKITSTFILQDSISEEKLTLRPPVFSFVCCKIMLEEDEYRREFASYKSWMIGCFAKVGYLPVHRIIIRFYLKAKL